MGSKMNIFYDGLRKCKKCQRDLPNNSLYFPCDKKCKDGLRSICRECNPKYKHFLNENHRTNEKWSNEDLELLKSIYKDYTNDEIIQKYFPNRSLRSLESISSKHGFSHKSQETLLRSLKIGASKNPMCQKGRSFTDEHKLNISMSQIKRYQRNEEREYARENALRRGLGKGNLSPTHLNPLYGERNGRWKGGASELIRQLRRDIVDWKKGSSEFCDYKCIITGGRFQNIHHVISFNSLVEQALNLCNLNRRSKILDYSNAEYQILKDCIIDLHQKTIFGACLCKEVHELFHKEYTYYNSSLDDFLDFINKIVNGYYDDYFLKNNLNKSFNYKYIDYLKEQSKYTIALFG